MKIPHRTTPNLRVAILDDHEIVRHGLSIRLAKETDLSVVGVYATAKEMVEGLRFRPADVLLVDYSLGPTENDGITLIKALKNKFLDSKVLIFSASHEPATVALALRAGADGFAGKCQHLTELVKGIKTVSIGHVYLDPTIAATFTLPIKRQRASDSAKPSDEALSLKPRPLSAREREVLRCYLEGMTVTQIAEKFVRSAKTVSTQKTTAFRKLGIRSNNELFKIKHNLDAL